MLRTSSGGSTCFWCRLRAAPLFLFFPAVPPSASPPHSSSPPLPSDLVVSTRQGQVPRKLPSPASHRPWRTGPPAVRRDALRFFATSRSLPARSLARRPPPARMVLSDAVARPPPAHARDPSTKARRRKVDGPFAGMNRTVANIKPRRGRAPGSSRATAAAPGTKFPSLQARRWGAGPGRNHENAQRRLEEKTAGERKTRFKALLMQRALATVDYSQRTNTKERILMRSAFDDFDLLPEVQAAIASEALKGLVETRPTPIQSLAIPALLGQDPDPRRSRRPRPAQADAPGTAAPGTRSEFLLAAETGSGKTLAYLVPIIDALKRVDAHDEAAAAWNRRLEAEKVRREGQPVGQWIERFEPHPNMARPRAVVLVPSAELVTQVTRVAKALAHVARLKIRPLSAALSPIQIQRNLFGQSGVDMVVSTPHLLASVTRSDPNVMSRVSHLVIDEADSLFDRSFAAETTDVLDRASPSLRQLVLCSATIPRRLDTFLASRFPHMRRLTTPNLHAIPRRVQLGVVDVTREPYRNDKKLACADAIWAVGREATRSEMGVGASKTDMIEVRRIMVFVNERETSQELADYLVHKGIFAVALHRDTDRGRVAEMLRAFSSREPLSVSRDSDGGGPGRPSRRLLNTQVIVATDLASRGIDTLGVRTVVLYDVPHTTVDFIHRLGRAGRMGRRGKGVVLVGRDDRRDVVAEVKKSMFMGQALV